MYIYIHMYIFYILTNLYVYFFHSSIYLFFLQQALVMDIDPHRRKALNNIMETKKSR